MAKPIRFRAPHLVLISIVITLNAMLVSCMVGPNFKQQPSPSVKSYTESNLPSKTASISFSGSAGKAQTYIKGLDITGNWWHLFHSPDIDALISMGLANNPTFLAAKAALSQAQENLYAEVGNLLIPAFDITAGAERERLPGTLIGSSTPLGVFNTFNTSVTVSYTLDIFGGSRRTIEAFSAQVDYQKYQVIAAYLTLTTNIVTTAITMASLDAQINTMRALIKSEETQLNIMQKQYRLGGVSDINVLTQQTLVLHTKATLPPLEKSLSQTRHTLAILIGAFPNKIMPKINLAQLSLPDQLPVSLPSNLVRQRPDIQAAEALLHVASAEIGVAEANLFPQFTITGNTGWSSTTLPALFSPVNKSWNIASAVTQALFHGGALFATRRAAIDAYDQAFEQYKQVLLQAFKNVADTLRALETDARTFRALKSAEIASRKNLNIATKQYQLGGVNYLDVLSAEQQYQQIRIQIRIQSIQAEALRYTDAAALFQALGGGWWNINPKQLKGKNT